MSSALVSSLYLIPDWVCRLLEDCENEGYANRSWNTLYVEDAGRKIIWFICSLLGVSGNGIPGQACRLLEQYLATKFNNNRHLEMYGEEWDDFVENMADEMPLLIAACVQLAAKMSSVSAIVDLKQVRNSLLKKNLDFTIAEYINAEHKVFSTLDYRLPLWSCLEVAELLAVEVGLPMSALKVLGCLVNLAEYYRHQIDPRVQWAANVASPSTRGGATLRTLHLAAGTVAATLHVLSYDIPDPIHKLSILTRVPPSYLDCIASCIRDCIHCID